MTELLNALVFGYRLVSYEYFLDNLQEYEIPLLVQGIPQADRPQWEQCRLRTFATASMFSKKELELTDILHFAWDSNEEEEEPTEDEIKKMLNTDSEQFKKELYGD